MKWAAVPGYRFEVTSDGRIRNPKTKRELKPMPMKSGHLYVNYDDASGTKRKLFVHQAVLLAFVGPCPLGQQTRHLNGIPTDNHLENLVWGTPLENCADRTRHGTWAHGETNGTAKLTESQVREIRLCRDRGESLRSIAARFGVSHTTVRYAAVGIQWAHVK